MQLCSPFFLNLGTEGTLATPPLPEHVGILEEEAGEMTPMATLPFSRRKRPFDIGARRWPRRSYWR